MTLSGSGHKNCTCTLASFQIGHKNGKPEGKTLSQAQFILYCGSCNMNPNSSMMYCASNLFQLFKRVHSAVKVEQLVDKVHIFVQVSHSSEEGQ